MDTYQPKEQYLIPRSHFLTLLRIEKQRADRSKAFLSLVLFYIQQKDEKVRGTIQEFVASLHKNTRESDIKGWVDRDVIGLILPDTNEKGVKNCVKKIAEANGKFNCSVTSGTYPDGELENLMKGIVIDGEEDAILQTISGRRLLEEMGFGLDENSSKNPSMEEKLLSLKDVKKKALQNAEVGIILNTLQKTHWKRRQAAKLLGISYNALLYKIQKYNLK